MRPVVLPSSLLVAAALLWSCADPAFDYDTLNRLRLGIGGTPVSAMQDAIDDAVLDDDGAPRRLTLRIVRDDPDAPERVGLSVEDSNVDEVLDAIGASVGVSLLGALGSEIGPALEAAALEGGPLDRAIERDLLPLLFQEANAPGTDVDGDGEDDCAGLELDELELNADLTDITITAVDDSTVRIDLTFDSLLLDLVEGRVRGDFLCDTTCAWGSLDDHSICTDDPVTVSLTIRSIDDTTPFPRQKVCGAPFFPYSPTGGFNTVPHPLEYDVHYDTDAAAYTSDPFERGFDHVDLDFAIGLSGDLTGVIAQEDDGNTDDKRSEKLQAFIDDLGLGVVSATIPGGRIDGHHRLYGFGLTDLSWPVGVDGRELAMSLTQAKEPNGVASDDIATGVDTCPRHFDPNQRDTDYDGVGDACDPSYTAGWSAFLIQHKVAYCEEVTWALSDDWFDMDRWQGVDPAWREAALFAQMSRYQDLSNLWGFDWRWIVLDDSQPPPVDWFQSVDQARWMALDNLAVLGAAWDRPALFEPVFVETPYADGLVRVTVERDWLLQQGFEAEELELIELAVPDRAAWVQGWAQ